MKIVTAENVTAYREVVLQVCADPTHQKYLLPAVPPGARRILDVGCHAGHILEVLNLPKDCEVFGCDVNAEALALARKCLPQGTFNDARAEKLPYADSYFDFVFSRGAVVAFDIPTALREFNRVLKPGGRLWISLHQWKDVRFILEGTWRTHPIKTTTFGIYVAMNSALFHYTGRLLRYPLNRSRIVSFQTESRMREELQKAGFGGIRVSRNNYFVIESDKLGNGHHMPQRIAA